MLAQREIERVFWKHRTWPEGNPGPKPSFDPGISEIRLGAHVDDYLAGSARLETARGYSISAEELQAEVDRMKASSRQPLVLEELFAALNHDPVRIQECLARPALVSRGASSSPESLVPCSDNTWTLTAITAATPTPRSDHSAVWTGTEMIVWGGRGYGVPSFGDGAKYVPATDTWTPISNVGAPTPRFWHSAVWSGREVIVWGGITDPAGLSASGSRYDPVADRWTPMSTVGAPAARYRHTAVWAGTRMVIWGGTAEPYWDPTNTGGRYDPLTDTWQPTSTTNCPSERVNLTAVWTGSVVIIHGGEIYEQMQGVGGRYDPNTDTWSPVSSAGSPPPTSDHTAVWTGSRMITWGGIKTYIQGPEATNAGGVYDPIADTWQATTFANAPSARATHTAVWTGSSMIIWGGSSGARYDPSSNSWNALATVPSSLEPRFGHSAVWTGSEMIVWGGEYNSPPFASGGRYCSTPCSPQTWYADVDGDGYGDPVSTQSSCDAPAGYVSNLADCDDGSAAVHPGALEICNSVDDDCTGQADDGEDSDSDGVSNLCDNCMTDSNPTQGDVDADAEGDMCDLDDGLILQLRSDRDHIEWQAESGPTSWNVYESDLDALRSSGEYTQAPGSNPLAERHCGVTDLFVLDPGAPPVGKVAFSLVTGVQGGDETTLGTDGRGNPRPNRNPCP